MKSVTDRSVDDPPWESCIKTFGGSLINNLGWNLLYALNICKDRLLTVYHLVHCTISVCKSGGSNGNNSLAIFV